MRTYRSLLAAACALAAGCAVGAPSRQTQAEARIEYATLSAQHGHVDCAPETVRIGVCRMRRSYSETALRAVLGGGQPVQVAGDELTFVAEFEADSVSLQGGLQYPMSRVEGTNLWVITLHVPGARQATVSYFFVPFSGGAPAGTSFTPHHWRGPDAPAAAPRAAGLQGRMVTDSLASALLRRSRHVGVYVPPARGNDPVVAVVYTGDGAAFGLAAAVDTLIVTGVLPRIMLVGIEADVARRGEPRPLEDRRSLEYLYLPDADSTYFLAHEQFVLEEVIPWAEQLGAPSSASRRGIAGFSNSAAMALDMGLRNPGVFGTVIALSPGGRTAGVLPGTTLPTRTRFFITGGRLEGAFHRKAVSWAEVLREHGVVHTLREPVAGHDFEVWMSLFVEALGWAFSGSPAGGDR